MRVPRTGRRSATAAVSRPEQIWIIYFAVATVDNGDVAVLQQFETTTGPVVVDGRTIALVAKTRAIEFGGPLFSMFHVRSRPAHVEILDGDGHRQVVPIRDLQRTVTGAIIAAAVACVIGARLRRRDT